MSFAKLLVLNSVLSLWYDSINFRIRFSRLINEVSEIETLVRYSLLVVSFFLIGICVASLSSAADPRYFIIDS